MAAQRLTGPEIEELQQLLRAAFRPTRFEEFLLYRLDRHIDDYAGRSDDYRTMLRRVIEEANAALWWIDLLAEARKAVPGDSGLLAFGERFGLSPAVLDGNRAAIPGRQLELKIKQANPAFDVVRWRTRLGEIEGRVCRVEYPERTAMGTGFLVGPEVVLTNYHVVEPLLTGTLSPQEIVFRFDHKAAADGVTVAAGTVHRLAADWRIDESPYSRRDEEIEPAGLPGAEELDYALLRLAARAGDEPAGGQTKDPAPVPRGWIGRPAAEHDFTTSPALFIVQHPAEKPMRVALDTDAVIGMNENGTRVRYTTTTDEGSSGSPCFDRDWRWVALHQAGDPKYWHGLRPTFNQGIPVSAIHRLTVRRGTDAAFGE